MTREGLQYFFVFILALLFLYGTVSQLFCTLRVERSVRIETTCSRQAKGRMFQDDCNLVFADDCQGSLSKRPSQFEIKRR